MRKMFSRLISSVLATTVLASSLVIGSPVSVLAAPSFSSVGGWNETIYAQISGVSDSNVTGVSYSGPTSGSLSGDDLTYLVRDNKGGVRIDIPGLKAGTYSLTVTTSSGTVTQSNIKVPAQDRSGYAHFNYNAGVGAYNNDGTLKANAKVIYVTDANKNTVSVTSKDGTTVTGIGHILNSSGQQSVNQAAGLNSKGGKANNNNGIIKKLADDGTPLVVRLIGTVNCPDGLTAYDSVDYGGTKGDNGAMARMQSGKDITIEGIGYDAQIKSWGIHFICQSSSPELGKSFEVRNLEFWGSPEDSIGCEGVQEGSTITASVERVWVHNCSFLPQSLSQYAESDKSEGDGCCDFKRGQYMTMSYCYFYNAHKTNLIGSSDDSLQYHVTWHHNYWQNCEARGPLVRNTNIHIYNNYYSKQTSYAMNPRANAYIFSEYNTMEYCKNPMTVDSGAIKSYKDTLLSCGGDQQGTIVSSKSDKVNTSNKYANFDTNSSVSYIPSGNYILQESAAEAKATCLAYSGTMKETVITEDDVDASVISAANRPTAPVALPFSASYGKNGTNAPTSTGNSVISNVVYNPTKIGTTDMTIKGEGIVFNLAQSAKVTMTGISGSYNPVLSSATGEVYITTSGTAVLPAGTYVIQSSGFDAGQQTFKECKVSALQMVAANPDEVVETTTIAKVTEASTEATTKAPVSGGDDEDTEATTSAPYTGSGLVWNYTDRTNTLGVSVNANDWSSAASVSYNGTTLNSAVKMESSSTISFTAPAAGNLTLVTYSSKNPATVVVNGETVTVSQSGATTVPVSAGTVTITKGTASTYLYLLEFTGSSTVETTTQATTKATEATTEATTQATTKATEATTEATTSAPVQGFNVKVGTASVAVNNQVVVPVTVTGGVIGSYIATVTYDASKLTFVSAKAGASDAGIDFDANNSNGTIIIAATNANGIATPTLFNLTFTAKAEGTGYVGLYFDEIVDANDADVAPTITSGSVTITAASAVTKLGDVDLDGDVDEVDAALLLKHLYNGVIITNAASLANADCDGISGTDVRDVIWILNNKSTSTDTTTTTTTEATTEATTQATTEATTQATTQAPVSGNVISSGYELTPSNYNSDAFFTKTGDFSSNSSSRIRMTSENSLTFNVAAGASVYITAAHASSTSEGTRTLTLKNSSGTTVGSKGYEMGVSASEALYAAGLTAGTYTLTADNHINVTSIRIVFGTVETSTEATTKATTTTTKATTTTEATTEATTQAPVDGAAAMGTYNFGPSASGGTFNITSKAACEYGNVKFQFRDMTTDGAKTRKNDGYTNIQLTLASATKVTITSSGKGMVATSSSGTEYEFAVGTSTVTLPAGSYTIQGSSTSSNSAISQMILGSGSGSEVVTQATTKVTEASTEATTNKATTTTKSQSGGDDHTETTTIDLSGAIVCDSASEVLDALKNASAGDTINIKAGTYTMSSTISMKASGSASNPIIVTCSDGMATLDFNGKSGRAITVSGKYMEFSNLVIKKGGDNGMYVTGGNIDITNCIFQANGDTGLQISQGGNNVYVKNCTSFDNIQTENADGFAAKLGAGQNIVFDGCIAYCNSDDGWDLFSKSGSEQNKYPIKFIDCIAFSNGTLTNGTVEKSGDRNGFKLGGNGYGAAHTMENCIAFNNGACGYVDNDNPDLALLKNCTGYNNAVTEVKKHNFSIYRATKDLKMTNCLSYVLNKDTDGGKDRFDGTSSGTSYKANATVTNSVLGYAGQLYKIGSASKITTSAELASNGTAVTVSDSDFVSLALPYKSLQTVHQDMRYPDGSIKLNGFLQPKAGSVIEGMGAQFD